VSLDAYLESPYCDAAADEAIHEAFIESDAYDAALCEWALDDDTTLQRFEASNAYQRAFEAWVEAQS
jgi:hypothetical protein